MSGKQSVELDPVIEFYKKDVVDRSLLRENLKLTAEERFIKLMKLQQFAQNLRRAAKESNQLEALMEEES